MSSSPSRTLPYLPLLLVLLLISSGCELIGNIFQAGMWVGVIGLLLVLGIIGFLVTKLRR